MTNPEQNEVHEVGINISEDEMIAAFLKGELNSKRFGEGIQSYLQTHNLSSELIKFPDTNNTEQNKLRELLFSSYRNYKENKGLFENFPIDVHWKRRALAAEELKKVKYINYDYWVELSGGSRSPVDAAKNIIIGQEIFNQSNQQFLDAAATLKKGEGFPELILVSTDEQADLVILEGHLRLTAYMLAPQYIPSKISVIIGYSKNFTKWDLY